MFVKSATRIAATRLSLETKISPVVRLCEERYGVTSRPPLQEDLQLAAETLSRA